MYFLFIIIEFYLHYVCKNHDYLFAAFLLNMKDLFTHREYFILKLIGKTNANNNDKRG